MIKDQFDNLDKYQFSKNIVSFLDEIKHTKEISELDLPFKAIPLNYNTKEFDLTKFENHQKYIDIHYIIKGKELIGITKIDKLKPNVDYDEEIDYQLFDGKTIEDTIVLSEGEFLLLFPHEPHVTGGMVNNQVSAVEKIVFKVPL